MDGLLFQMALSKKMPWPKKPNNDNQTNKEIQVRRITYVYCTICSRHSNSSFQGHSRSPQPQVCGWCHTSHTHTHTRAQNIRTKLLEGIEVLACFLGRLPCVFTISNFTRPNFIDYIKRSPLKISSCMVNIIWLNMTELKMFKMSYIHVWCVVLCQV